jgi:hypothetical protein
VFQNAPQALEIMFEVQRKKNNEKIARRKIIFSNSQNVFFFFFPSLWTPPTLKAS